MIVRLVGLILGISLSLAQAAELNQVTLSQRAPKTALFFTINGAFTHKIFTLDNPTRVVIDFYNMQLRTQLMQLGKNNPLIRQARTGFPNPKTLRIVLEVNQPVHVRSTPWHSGKKLKGIEVELITHTPKAALLKDLKKGSFHSRPPASVYRNKTMGNPAKIRAEKVSLPITHHVPIAVPHVPSRSLREVVVVLDAGHGGKDPGARGPANSREKTVVLAITLKLKQLIDKQPGMKAVLTRRGDYYVGLRKRLDIARKYNGDIFVSIHADAYNNPHSQGASVFALSQLGATSEAARWIAEKENYSELGGVNLGDLDDTNGVVRSVLIDLSQTATINSSLQMGRRVLNQLNHFTRLHHNKVEQARFMVLKSPDIPSILVETGFISNPLEEKNLTSAQYQSRLCQAIFEGIKGYFWENPPQGSRIEALANSRLHIVRAGETLPGIASHYHIPITALQRSNHLASNKGLKSGQQLMIPKIWS